MTAPPGENAISAAMPRRRHNTQLFALPAPPPGQLAVGGASYRLVRVFKHDFFAATCLYEAAGEAEIPRIVVKLYRTQPFCGLGLAWLGRLSRDHERAVYAALAGVAGVPRWVGCVGQAGCAIEYIDAVAVDRLDSPPAGYFDGMRAILDAVHARGVAYVDANKLSNMLAGPDGQAHLVDFQIALRRRDDWPPPARALLASIVRYLQGRDLYHLYKHKRRAGEELTEDEERLSRRRGRWHAIHRKLTKPYRALRRRFLRRQHRAGRLVSPTADIEEQPPEHDTWKGD